MKTTTELLNGLLIFIASIGLYNCKGKLQGNNEVKQDNRIKKQQ